MLSDAAATCTCASSLPCTLVLSPYPHWVPCTLVLSPYPHWARRALPICVAGAGSAGSAGL